MYSNNHLEFMPFGSMVNAYGQVNEGSKIDIDKFLVDMEKILKLAKEMVKPEEKSLYPIGSNKDTNIPFETKKDD